MLERPYSFGYTKSMYTIKTLPEFDDWLNGLNDGTTRLRLAKRLDKAARGLLGDTKALGEGLHEMREHFGAGYRMYYTQRQDVIIIMLAGGDKSGQSRDIEKARQRMAQLEE